MNNNFLDMLSKKPIRSTFKLAFKMLLSNKLLFIILMLIVVAIQAIQMVIPALFLTNFSMVFMIFTIIFLSVFFQVFTQSNYFYVCRMVLDSKNEEECINAIVSTKVSAIFTNYFFRALGSSIAIILMVVPLFIIRETLHLGEYLNILYMLLLLLGLYIYPVVAYKITLSQNFKEAFLATFSIFSPKVWRQSFKFSYAKIVISLAVILVGVYSLLIFIMNYLVNDMYSDLIFMVTIVISVIFGMFFALYVLPVYMMIVQYISGDEKNR